MCSGSAEPSIWLAHILAVQLLKFSNHAICCNAPTLNNSQNLNLDFLAVSFWVQWTPAHGSVSKCLISGVTKIYANCGKNIEMICYASWALFVYNILKLWHITGASTSDHRWVINAQTGLVFFGPPVFLYAFFNVRPTCQTISRFLHAVAQTMQSHARVCLFRGRKFKVNIWLLKNPSKSKIEPKNGLRNFRPKMLLYKIFIYIWLLIVIISI